LAPGVETNAKGSTKDVKKKSNTSGQSQKLPHLQKEGRRKKNLSCGTGGRGSQSRKREEIQGGSHAKERKRKNH